MFKFGKKREDAELAQGNTEKPVPALPEGSLEISADERAEFEEFRRQKKLLEMRRLLRMIDHTLLKQTATRTDIKNLCDEAREYGFYSVCVQPVYVAACCEFLKNSPNIKIACVVGFPMGENKTETKVY